MSANIIPQSSDAHKAIVEIRGDFLFNKYVNLKIKHDGIQKQLSSVTNSAEFIQQSDFLCAPHQFPQ